MPAATVDSTATGAPARGSYNGYRFYSFRIWNGMVASAWLSLLVRNRFAVTPTRLPSTLLGFVTATANSIINVVQALIFARRIRACVIEEPPIFIIGHWRTGTTFLHELLMVDGRFTAPTTIECFAPAVCLILDQFLRHVLNFALPRKRPMDNMPLDWDRPQEDEFALMNLGLGSPYEVLLFPNHRSADHPFLDMSGLSPGEIERWKAGFLRFLQQVNLRSKKQHAGPDDAPRIVLKTPYHTARLRILREIFPKAKFIHIVRDPCEVFPSTLRFWRALFDTQGCQKPQFGALATGIPDLEQYVFESMDLLYRNFFEESAEIPAGHLCQVRYEDLVRAPVEEVRRIYSELDLGSFETVRPKLEAHVRGLAGYETNQHQISPRERAEVHRRWHWYMHRFGYQCSTAA